MTTVSQMIEWLQTLPQDAIVECGVEKRQGWDTYMAMQAVDFNACEIYDLTKETIGSYAGKVVVELHGE